MVTATVCLRESEIRRSSIGSSVARVSGLMRARPSSTTRTRVFVLLPRRILSPDFSSIRFSAHLADPDTLSLAPYSAGIRNHAGAHATAAPDIVHERVARAREG